MRTLLFLSAFSILTVFAACKKDSPDTPAPANLSYVLAGNPDRLYSPEMDPIVITVPSNAANGTHDLDVNHDGVMDYHLRIHCPFQDHSLESWIGIESYDLNEVAATYSQPTWIKSFHANDSIDGGEGWYACSVLFYEAPQATGYWIGVTNRYVGIRVHAKNKVLYGWISVQVVPPDKLIVNGYGSQQ